MKSWNLAAVRVIPLPLKSIAYASAETNVLVYSVTVPTVISLAAATQSLTFALSTEGETIVCVSIATPLASLLVSVIVKLLPTY